MLAQFIIGTQVKYFFIYSGTTYPLMLHIDMESLELDA